MGGSAYFKSLEFTADKAPQVRPQDGRKLMEALSRATGQGLVKACHDLSEGGIGVALAEMAFAGGLGASVKLKEIPLGEQMDRDDCILFSESNSRFLAEVSPEDKDEFEKLIQGTASASIGQVNNSGRVVIEGLDGNKILDESIDELKESWQKPLKW
jgi:phosphoribosylformylglycinamidine synthase